VRKPVAKNFQACAVYPASEKYPNGVAVLLSEHTTARAALNAMAFRAFFGAANCVYRVREKRTGRFVAELSR
jgi:hypothetical protein